MGGLGLLVVGVWTCGAIKKEFDFIIKGYGPGLGFGRLSTGQATDEATAFSDRAR